MIKLKEGQKVLDEDGNVYVVEHGDLIEGSSFTNEDDDTGSIIVYKKLGKLSIQLIQFTNSHGGENAAEEIVDLLNKTQRFMQKKSDLNARFFVDYQPGY